MGEIKQTNFRIDQDTATAFRKFCEDNGMNQAQGFDHVMQVVELDRAKTVAPGRATEIESFEKSVKDIMAAYLNSLEINATAEVRIREQFASDLTRKDKTIDELRDKIKQLQTAKEAAEAMSAEAASRESVATAQAEAAQRTAADQERINAMLTIQLTEATEKLDGAQEAVKECDKRKTENAELRDKIAKVEQALEEEKKTAESNLTQAKIMAELDNERIKNELSVKVSEAERALEEERKSAANSLAQAKMQAALDTERAVMAKEREMQVQLREADKENAKLVALVEQYQAQLARLVDGATGKQVDARHEVTEGDNT